MSKPKIRFKGYEEDWEQRKLPEFVTFFNGLTYTPDDVEETGTLVLRSSNVKNGEIVDADNVYVNDKVVTSENVQEGDIIVVVRNGSRALIGKHAQIKAPMPNTVIGAFMSGIRSEHSSFVNALLDTSAFENEIAKNMGATINQITGYMFSKMEFMIPSGEEQQKIGEYFQSFDDLITLHQRKCEETKKLKKYMLQKMFPQNGKRVPEIRFAGFTDDWEQRKLSEIATMHARIGWQNLRTSEFLDSGDYMLITGTDFEDGTINYSTCHYVEKERYEQDKNIQIRNGSILITKDGTLGKVAYVQGLTMPATLNAGVFNVEIKDKKETDEKYLFQYLKAPFLMDYVTRHATGGTIKHLNQSILINFPVYMPKKSEQEKIGLYLMQLDSLITLHQRKYEELQKIKKFMLQNMFI
ncbi:restriction endonuclease subunit S [Anaerostipes sp.]|uniref:restriction endonuclease subunit S n=1 Tax=Anaerostipes sp. TaxID=1872530 RepID=UPI003528D372